MENIKLSMPTVEYAEEKPLNEQYDEWKQYQMMGTLINENQTYEQITNRYNLFRLSMVALVVSLVALIINLIIKFTL